MKTDYPTIDEFFTRANYKTIQILSIYSQSEYIHIYVCIHFGKLIVILLSSKIAKNFSDVSCYKIPRYSRVRSEIIIEMTL